MNFGSLVYTSLPISKQPGSMHGLINSLTMATIIVASWRPGTVNFLRTLKLHGRSSTIGLEIILKTRSSTTPTKFSKQESEEVVKRLGIFVFFACSSRYHPRFTDTCCKVWRNNWCVTPTHWSSLSKRYGCQALFPTKVCVCAYFSPYMVPLQESKSNEWSVTMVLDLRVSYIRCFASSSHALTWKGSC